MSGSDPARPVGSPCGGLLNARAPSYTCRIPCLVVGIVLMGVKHQSVTPFCPHDSPGWALGHRCDSIAGIVLHCQDPALPGSL